MPIRNCRGDDAKRRIVEEYDLKPLAHSRIIPGHKWDGCCGPLTDKFYVFEYKPKGGGHAANFYVGDHCAEKFLEILGLDSLPLFNPLVAPAGAGAGAAATAASPGGSSGVLKRDPLNQELWNALNLTLTLRQITATGGLATLLEKLNAYPARLPFPDQVQRVNNYRRKIGQTLRQEINAMVQAGTPIRGFSFPLIRDLLKSLGDPDFIDP